MQLVQVEPIETLSQRAQRLMTEAREAAAGQVTLLEEALTSVHLLSTAVADGGDIYPIGVRDLSRKLCEDAAWCAQTITAIMKNTGFRKAGAEADQALGLLDESALEEAGLDEIGLGSCDEPHLARVMGGLASHA